MGCNLSQNPNDPNILPSVGSIPIVTSIQQQNTKNTDPNSSHQTKTREIKLRKKQQIPEKDNNENQNERSSSSDSDTEDEKSDHPIIRLLQHSYSDSTDDSDDSSD